MRYLSLVVATLALLMSTALADVYMYRGPDGRLWMTSEPPPEGVEPSAVVKTKPPGETAPPTVEKPPKPDAQAPAPVASTPQVVAVPVRPPPVPEPEAPKAEPIDTKEFGLLRMGMSQGQVKRRVGPPEERIDHGTQLVRVVVGMRAVTRTVHKETWLYPGTRSARPVRLVFHDALLAEKVKEDR